MFNSFTFQKKEELRVEIEKLQKNYIKDQNERKCTKFLMLLKKTKYFSK